MQWDFFLSSWKTKRGNGPYVNIKTISLTHFFKTLQL